MDLDTIRLMMDIRTLMWEQKQLLEEINNGMKKLMENEDE